MKRTMIITAAGNGARMESKIRKIWLPLEGESVLAHTLARVRESGLFAEVLVAVHKDDLARAEKLSERFGFRAVEGGASRTETVKKALEEISEDAEAIFTHDAVRPFADAELMRRVATALETHDAVVPVVPVVDTVKLVTGGFVYATPSRERLMRVQTPQGFRRAVILRAYEHPDKTATDDASLVERAGYRVYTVAGDERNIKITTPADTALARVLMEEARA